MLEIIAEYSLYLAFCAGCLIGGSVIFAVLKRESKLLERSLSDKWQRELFERSAQGEKDELKLRSEHESALASLRHQFELKNSSVVAQLEHSQSRVQQLESDIAALRELKEQHTRLEAQYKEQSTYIQTEKNLLNEAKLSLFKEFELAANKLFEAKQENFSKASRENIEVVLNPFKTQLKDFHKRVEDIYHKENTERNQLVGKIAELQKQTQQISTEANSLANALKGDNKAQGDWGEVILEKLLEQSGLQKGREYETQKTLTDSEGKRYKPDVIVRLPDEKDIIIDAKVSLKAYQNYCDAGDKSDQDHFLKSHLDSLRQHMKSLSVKQYEKLENVRTLDFVFIFIPIESAYILAMQSSPELFKEAYEKNIVMVSPTSLMVALRTVEMLWRYEKQNRHAEIIADSAGKLYDQFVLLANSFEDIGTYLDKSLQAYEKSRRRLVSGRGNLLGRVDKLKQLGAKTSKTLPQKYRDELISQSDSENSQVLASEDLAPEVLASVGVASDGFFSEDIGDASSEEDVVVDNMGD